MKNVFGNEMQPCSSNPLTGYSRNSYCNVDPEDCGKHIVCALVTDKFLKFTLEKGNDLITPRPGFPGLKHGDKWCLCVIRWIEAYGNDSAPLIYLESTPEYILKYVSFNILLKYRA